MAFRKSPKKQGPSVDRNAQPGTSLQTRQGGSVAPPKGRGKPGKPAKRKRGKKAAGPSAPLHDRRRRLVSAREATLRDLGGLMLEMYKRNRFREELLLDKCEEVLAVEVEIAHIDQRLFQLAPPNAAGVRAIGRCECGSPIYPGQNFCGVCGRGFATLTQNRMCERCGAGLRPGDSFCGTCGNEGPDVLDTFEVHAPPPLPAGTPASSSAQPATTSSHAATPPLDETTVIPTTKASPPPLPPIPEPATAATPAPAPAPPSVDPPVPVPASAPTPPTPFVTASADPPTPVVPPPVVTPVADKQQPAARYEPPFAASGDRSNETAISAALSSLPFDMPRDQPALDFPASFSTNMQQAEGDLTATLTTPPTAAPPRGNPLKGPGAPGAPPAAAKPLNEKQARKLEKMQVQQREKLAKDKEKQRDKLAKEKAKVAQKRAKERAKAARKGGGKGA